MTAELTDKTFEVDLMRSKSVRKEEKDEQTFTNEFRALIDYCDMSRAHWLAVSYAFVRGDARTSRVGHCSLLHPYSTLLKDLGLLGAILEIATSSTTTLSRRYITSSAVLQLRHTPLDHLCYRTPR